MKICFFGNARNVHLCSVASRLARRGHEVRVVCHKPVAIAGVAVEQFAVPPLGLKYACRWATRWSRYLRGFLRRFDCVVLFFLHDWGFTSEMFDDGCFVAYPQGSDVVPPPGETPPTQELIDRRVSWLRHARAVGRISPSFAEPLARFAGLEVGHLDPLPLGVDGSRFRRKAPLADRRDGAYRVGFFKGFREVYGSTYLVRAMPTILAAQANARFDMVGEGAQLDPCRVLVDQLGVGDAVRWIDRVPHEAVPDLLAEWTVSVVPSVCESFGVAAIESQAMEVPVVASNVGGLPDAVRDGETGLLVPPESPDAIAEAVVSLLSDGPRRERMGRAGRAWVRSTFDWSIVLDQWEETLFRARDRSSVMV